MINVPREQVYIEGKGDLTVGWLSYDLWLDNTVSEDVAPTPK